MSTAGTGEIGIGIIGAGISGLLMGIRLKQAGIDHFTIYEKSDDVGGTWKHNTYPGLHCDVPSHLYSYSFAPNPNWTQPFAAQREIQAYLRDCADKFGLNPHLRMGISIETARYQQNDGMWELTTESGEVIRHNVLVGATGGLTAPSLPKVSGLERFEGLSWHSGAWRHDIDLTGKRVAVIGSAASAVQVVPHVADTARELFVFQRSPNWVMPRRNTPYSDAMKAAFADPGGDALRRHRRELYRGSLLTYRVFRRDPRAIALLRAYALKHMKSAISDPDMIATLTPDYDPGCKRLLVSDEYYPALAKPHVHLIASGVEELTENAVLATDGRRAEVDIVIFCTGYKRGGREDGRPAVEIIGPNDLPLLHALYQRPYSYRGVAVPGFPNYFTICGINGTVAYSSLFYSAELHADYILRCIQEMRARGLKSVDARADIAQAHSESLQEELQKMSWSTGQCTNFYLAPDGRNLSFYPGSLGRLRRELGGLGLDEFTVET